MQICVVGWSYPKDFYEVLKYESNVFVVAKRECPFDIEHEQIENIGLEWYAYDWFLKHKWDYVSPVFFTHDDTKVHDPVAFEKIRGIRSDIAMIFRNRREGIQDSGYHGRAWRATAPFLREILAEGGIWFDEKNTGQMDELNPNESGLHYNAGVWKIKAQIKRITEKNPKLTQCMYFVPEYEPGVRGKTGLEAVMNEIEIFSKRKAKVLNQATKGVYANLDGKHKFLPNTVLVTPEGRT